MQSFAVEAQTSTQTPKKKIVDVDSSSKSTKEDMNALLKGLKELNFNHPRIQKKVLQRAFKIWSNAQLTQMWETKRKRSELPASEPEGEIAIKQAR